MIAGLAVIGGVRLVFGEEPFERIPLLGGASTYAGASADEAGALDALEGDRGNAPADLFGSAPAGYEVTASELMEGDKAAYENTRYLQHVIDAVSEAGGGVVHLPAGTFRFAAGGSYDDGDYAIAARSNVAIVGAGREDTTLMPVGNWALTGKYRNGVDMFWYDGMSTDTYLANADFADLTVDGIAARGSVSHYNASGKGFFFKLFRDCDWNNVAVKNTDGTGFGVDFPIACTLIDCVATGCGKIANENSVGASGFGIGVGYSSDESILIENCFSRDNTKYGFFFEHQSLFRREFRATEAAGFVVRGCVASGNLYNFGGNRAYDIRYESCVSAVSDDDRREAYTSHAYMLERNTVRVTFEQCAVDQSMSDVNPSDACYDAVRWALDSGIVEAGSDNVHAFRPDDAATRREAAFMFWRLAGWPGDVLIGPESETTPAAADVPAKDPCAEAVRWLRGEGYSIGETFRPDDTVTNAEAATLLWRYAGEPGDSGEAGAAGEAKSAALPGTAPYYAGALTWAVKSDIMTSYQASLPFAPVSRAELVQMVYRFSQMGEGVGR